MSDSFKKKAMDRIIKLFDELVDPLRKPEAMTRDEYKDFLAELISDLEGRLEAAEKEDEEEEDEILDEEPSDEDDDEEVEEEEGE